ncbi:hypothetical protein K9E78_11790 [Staphylococcus pseudintermedius]|nr:hypothetical protein K9E78_11790 [Staphylococcus pseudintermedius]
MMMESGVTMAKINILNKVFSKNVLRELIREGESDLLNKAYYQIFNDDAHHLNNHKKIEQLYAVLKRIIGMNIFLKTRC